MLFRSAHRGRHARIEGVEHDVGRHDRGHPRPDRRVEGRQLDRPKSIEVVSQDGKIVMTVQVRVSVTGEVLGTRRHPTPLHRPDQRRTARTDQRRIAPERARTDDRIRRVRVDVDHRGEVEVDPEAPLAADLSALEARLGGSDGEVQGLPMTRIAADLYEARFPLAAEGVALPAIRLDDDGTYPQTVSSGALSSEATLTVVRPRYVSESARHFNECFSLAWAQHLLDNREFVKMKGRFPSSDPRPGQDDVAFDSDEEERDLYQQDLHINAGGPKIQGIFEIGRAHV